MYMRAKFIQKFIFSFYSEIQALIGNLSLYVNKEKKEKEKSYPRKYLAYSEKKKLQLKILSGFAFRYILSLADISFYIFLHAYISHFEILSTLQLGLLLN